jgi:hypothetical protein
MNKIERLVEGYLTEAKVPKWSIVKGGKPKPPGYADKKTVRSDDIYQVMDDVMEEIYSGISQIDDEDQFEHDDGSLEVYIDQGQEDGSVAYVQPSKKDGQFTVYTYY